MTLTLEQYCEKYNYEIVGKYETIGEERGWHRRAIVEDKETKERYYLYFDRSYRRRTLGQQKEDGVIQHYTIVVEKHDENSVLRHDKDVR